MINYPIELRKQINSLAFDEKGFLMEILLEENRIKELEAEIEFLRMKRDSDLRGEQGRIRDLEYGIRSSEMSTKHNIAVEERRIYGLTSEIESLKRERDKIVGVVLKQPLTASPVTAKTKRNVLLATVVGLFLMVFLAFFLEYIQKHKGESRS